MVMAMMLGMTVTRAARVEKYFILKIIEGGNAKKG